MFVCVYLSLVDSGLSPSLFLLCVCVCTTDIELFLIDRQLFVNVPGRAHRNRFYVYVARVCVCVRARARVHVCVRACLFAAGFGGQAQSLPNLWILLDVIQTDGGHNLSLFSHNRSLICSQS